MDPLTLQRETQTILDMMGIRVKAIDIIQDQDLRITVISIRVPGAEQDLFTDHHNELSRDLGLILRLVFEKKHRVFKDITVDVNGENLALINHTKEKAALAVERVTFFDKPYEFGYLSSYERMIVHSYLKNVPEVVTESHGEGKERRLVVKRA